MSSSSDLFQNSVDSYQPKQELESPFLNEEFLVDEARIAQWRVPVPGVQLESPFLEAFEEEEGAIGEVEEFEEFLNEMDEEEFEEEEAIDEYKSNEKYFITNEGLEESQVSGTKLPIKEVIYVHGKYNPEKLVLNPWKWSHPRGSRSNTALSLFDYDLGKHKRWDNWDGKLPPTQAPNNESVITSVLDLYAFIKALPSASVTELHFFTHGWMGGPILCGTYDYEADPNKRDPNDQDPRIKDFKDPSVLGGVEGQKFKAAFSPFALVKLWGCTYVQSYRDLIRDFFKKETTKKQKEKNIKDYQYAISRTYQFILHQAIDIPVYAAPLGYGADPSLPVGIDGNKAKQWVDKKMVKYRGIWPPKKGDQWWKITAFFGSDKGRYFYKKVLGANLDILDYVAYTKTLIDPALQKNLITNEFFTDGEEVEAQEFEEIFDEWDEEKFNEGEEKANPSFFINKLEPETETFHRLLNELEEEILWEEVAELMPPRVFQSEIDQVQIDYETPPVHLFEHWFQPMKRDAASNSWIADGKEKVLVPINPGFFDASGTLKTSSLNNSLKDLLTRNPEFSQHLSKDALRDGKAKGQDNIRVALVDLTGSKLLYPEFAGWGSTAAVNGASCVKVAPLYAAFQLRRDLKHVADKENITQMTELIRFMEDQWKKSGIDSPPRLRQFLDPSTSLPDIKFSTDVEIATSNIIDQHKANNAAKVLIDIVGFHFIASLMWQSGLRHPTQGGLWLMSSYGGGMRWKKPSMPPPTPIYGYNATALSLATFFTLLAQDRLVGTSLPKTMKTALSTASWFKDTLPSASIASKVGLLTKCLRLGPKMRGSLPVLDKNNMPVLVCKETQATHVHEAALIENDKVRYAVAIMTTGLPTGISLLQKLIGELDGLIRMNNP